MGNEGRDKLAVARATFKEGTPVRITGRRGQIESGRLGVVVGAPILTRSGMVLMTVARLPTGVPSDAVKSGFHVHALEPHEVERV
jgi:hypothetical protein